ADKRVTLVRVATRISAMTEDLYYNHSLLHERMMKTFISSMTNEGQIHVIICDANGQIFLTSDDYGNKYMNLRVNGDILNKTEKVDTFSAIGTLDGIYEGENYTVGVAVRNETNKPIAYVYVTTSIQNIQLLMTYVRNLFFLISLVVSILAVCASYFFVRKMIKPLKRISDASQKFAQGDFSTRVPVESEDEIGEMTTAFNNMADSLEKSEDLRRSFIANVSHELRSPMTSISGFVDGILDGTIPEEKSEYYLNIVSEEVHRLSRLVSRMLDVTVLQSTDITQQSHKFDFCELLRRVVINFEQRINEKALCLHIELPETAIDIFANEDAVYQVVYNLLENAIKFSAKDSKIIVKVEKLSDKLIFSVRNHGVEIPRDQLKYVFDRFHKTDGSRSKDKSGLGLGLYIAKTIINQHKGKIWAMSEQGYTEFSFTLPLKK
ncbi:MAG: HAMP domain-containing histidine kinase, partial [Clostridia bacterium]|nr:HAMP domain-containing histidine kinase [Clostridia bacterium]